jgi:G:T-mismatch repair DNA endonuclease (very short patch repair protein)
MDIKTEKKIVAEYKKGKSSLEIVKNMGISKYFVLKIINKYNIVRKRDRCKKLDIKKDGEKYYVIRKCPKCGKEIKTISKESTIACRNHYNKINENRKCVKCMGESFIGEGNHFFKKKHTKESLEKMSKSKKGQNSGDKNHMKQEKYRQMSRDIMRSNWDNGILDRKVISEQMKQTHKSGKIKSGIVSKREKEIVNEIKQMGYKLIPSYRVDSKICDVYIPSLNLIIEYFGDYWHCNPKKYESDYFNYKKNKFAWELWDYDKKKIDLIKSYGYNLEVVWEGDLKLNNKLINIIIEKYVTKSTSTPKWSRKD